MTATFEGVSSTDTVLPGAKFRATWQRDMFGRLSVFPTSARAAEQAIIETGPTKGFFVVSPAAAAPEDNAIVLDVRVQNAFRGSAGQLASALDEASGFDLVKLAAIGTVTAAPDSGVTTAPPNTETAAEAAAARASAQAKGEKAAAAATPDPLGAVSKSVKSLVMWVAIGAGAFLVLTNIGTIKAAGRAIQRAVK